MLISGDNQSHVWEYWSHSHRQKTEGATLVTDQLAHNFGPEVVEVLERAFEDVWTVLEAHLDPESECGKELGITLGRTLVGLAANGVTDRQELRRQALQIIPLTAP